MVCYPYEKFLRKMNTMEKCEILSNKQFPKVRRCLFQIPAFFILFLVGLLSLPAMSLAEEDTWTRKADMPTPRTCLSTSVVDGKIYAIGGLTQWGGGTALSPVEEYDPGTDTWIRKSDMPTPRYKLSTNVVNGKIYAIGGWNWSNFDAQTTVEEYDPVIDTWIKKSDMPTPRGAHIAGMVNGKIYVIGGWDGGLHSTVEEYDPETDTWTRKADMPTARCHFMASVVNDKIYAFGGWDGIKWLATVEEYDPVTDTWVKKMGMPISGGAGGSSVANGKIYGMGSVFTYEYDPETDTWYRKADLSTPRFHFAASAVNGYVYIIGGHHGSGDWQGLSSVEAYNTGVGIRVANISPQEGRITGGEAIAILGNGFPLDASVTIAGKVLTELKVTDTLITGITPPGIEGERNILITSPSIDFTVFAGKFFYNPLSNVVITRITPTNGKQAGGSAGSISGSDFLPGAKVTIDDVEATDVVVTATLITFKIPPGVEGAKDVVVTNLDGQKGILRGGYTYNPFPIVMRIEPDEGPLAGNTQVTITGEHFMKGVSVTIGGRQTRLGLFSPTELRFRTSAGISGPKEVRVINPDGQEVTVPEGFTYNPAPVISEVSPSMGSLEGGTEITIIGTGFLSRVKVFIDGSEASSVRILFPTKIMAKTPPSTPGIKDIEVINRDGQEATLENAFTYNPLPQISRIIPDNGRLAGGTKITIQGSSFLPDAKVLIHIDGNAFVLASSIQVMSPNIITAVTPSGEPGLKDVVVRNPDRQEIVLPDGFIYNPLPKITDISPNHGPNSGGTKIIIRGTGFLQGAQVIIGKRSGTAQVQDDTTIEAVTPKNPPGVFDVRVINPDKQEAIKQKGFIFVGEVAYNYPNPFRAEQGTTFRYVTNERVELIKVQIFNLRGVPIGVVGQSGSNEVRWYDVSVHAGLYVYLMEVKLDDGKVKKFKRMLEVYK